MSDNFEELLAEHRAHPGGIGPGVLRLLDNLARAAIEERPPLRYGGVPEWTREVVRDIASEWVTTSLWENGELAACFAQSGTEAELRRALTGSLRHFLVDRVEKEEWYRLFDRADKKVLREDNRFEPVGTTRRRTHQGWTLRRSPSRNRSPKPLSRLLNAVRTRRDGTPWTIVRWGPDARIGDPILRQPQLVEFLELVLEDADGYLTLAQLAEVITTRFHLAPPVPLDLSIPLAARAEPGLRDETDESARRLVDQLSKEERELLRGAITALEGDPPRRSGLVERERAVLARALESAGTADREELAAILRTALEYLFEG